jgi:hypothetical protein
MAQSYPCGVQSLNDDSNASTLMRRGGGVESQKIFITTGANFYCVAELTAGKKITQGVSSKSVESEKLFFRSPALFIARRNNGFSGFMVIWRVGMCQGWLAYRSVFDISIYDVRYDIRSRGRPGVAGDWADGNRKSKF